MKTIFLLVLCLLLGFVLAGCEQGPAKGTVHGKVTLNGTPVDGGLIRLVPVDGDGQPEDCVITAGNYEITLPLGKRKVELTWSQGGSVEVDTATQGQEPKAVQLFPSKYNAQSELTHEVKPGKEERNFDIKTP